MKRASKKKGFTLTELLVAIVILGIIAFMAIPQITNLITSNESAKYESYEDTLKTSAKLYVDSYNEDMFGNSDTGCYDIKLSEMISKKMAEDFNSNNVTCNYNETFVRVRKKKDQYKYKVSIICKDKTNNELHYSNIVTKIITTDSFCSS